MPPKIDGIRRWTIPAELGQVSPLVLEAAAFLEGHGVGPKPLFTAQLLLEEIITNVVRHAFHGDATRSVTVEVALDPSHIALTIEDDAAPFDPLTDAPPPDIDAPLEDRTEGGLGIHLVKRMADVVTYERTPADENRVRMRVKR